MLQQVVAAAKSSSKPLRGEADTTEQQHLVGPILARARGTDNPARLHLVLGLPPIAIRDMVA
jgi:hypothetical protein